jgi:hypothetical protein
MQPRAHGATLAVVAAILFTVSLVTSAWWDGHPQVDGKTIGRKDVHIGLHGARGCNLGEQVTCEPLTVGDTFTDLGYGELGAVALADLLAILLAISAWRISDWRRPLARIAIGAALLAAAGAATLVVLGPDIKAVQAVHAPIGWGLFAFIGGVAATAAASVVTLRVDAEPLRLRGAQPAGTAPMFDVRDVLRSHHDGLRPSIPSLSPMPPSPGAAPAGAQPLFDGAPQLRPLYEHDGHRLPPAPPVPLPARGPTPIPRPSVDSGPIDPPPPSPYARPTPPKIPTMPPPLRGKPPTGVPPRSSPTIAHAVPPPPSADNLPAPPVLPAREDARASTETDDRLDTAMRDTDFVTAVQLDRDAAGASATIGPITAQERALAAGDNTDDVETAARERFSASELETAARERLSTSEIETAARERVSLGTGRIDLMATLEVGPQHEGTLARLSPAPAAVRASQVPISTASASLPPPDTAQVATTGPTPACPQCEAPMDWVEEHLRFYCKQCRMYF